MRLFYAIDSEGHFLGNNRIPSEKIAARDIIQRENSERFYTYLRKAFDQYDAGKEPISFLNKTLCCEIDLVFSIFVGSCSSDFKDNPLINLLELHRWERDYVFIVELFGTQSVKRVIFKSILLRYGRTEVLNAKLLVFKNLPEGGDRFSEKIEEICNNWVVDNSESRSKTLISSIKRAVRQYSKQTASWTCMVPLMVFRIIEAEKIFVLKMSRMKNITSAPEAMDFQAEFEVYKEILKYEEEVLLKFADEFSYGKKNKSRAPRRKNFETYIASADDKEQVLRILRKYMKNKRGKQAVMVIRSAYAAGLTTVEKVPYSSVVAEFGDIGAQSGYYRFFENSYLPIETCSNLIDKLKIAKG